MTSSTAEPEWQVAIREWDQACTFAHRPDIWPQRSFTVTRRNGGYLIREATTAAVTRAIRTAQAHPIAGAFTTKATS
ncbi:MAG TPA: hypothetical protein VMG38_14310 [Trebonia sp.]|nr:hypothetical protein [Trebonia sp.]